MNLGMEYRANVPLDPAEFVELYRASTLGERRPIDDPKIVQDMIDHANLTITAWDGELLVGIARTMTDFSYVGYLADLAVRDSHQKKDWCRADRTDAGCHGTALNARSARRPRGRGLLSAHRF